MKQRVVLLLLLLALAVALPSTALASKQVYKARLSTGAELHEVVGSTASGSAVVGIRPDGYTISLSVRGVSGPATAAHIHAPATETQSAGTVITLCGAPAPAVFGACPSGTDFVLQGDIPATAIRNMTPGEFYNLLSSGLTYVNVHTALNPAGETRGQLIPQ